MKIGLLQCNIIWENKSANLNKYAEALKDAKRLGIDLLLLPEMSATGFSLNIGTTAEAADGETVSFFRNACRENGVACGFGYTEKYGDKAMNKYIVCGNDGELLSSYTKIHPFSIGGEAQNFISGDEIPSFSLGGFRISTFICYDLRFPEIFQAASKSNDIITVAANWSEVRREQWLALLRARAIENQCFICGINRIGSDANENFCGDSVVFSPNGTLLANAKNTEGIIFFEPDRNAIDNLRSAFPQKNDRRPEMYKGLY